MSVAGVLKRLSAARAPVLCPACGVTRERPSAERGDRPGRVFGCIECGAGLVVTTAWGVRLLESSDRVDRRVRRAADRIMRARRQRAGVGGGW